MVRDCLFQLNALVWATFPQPAGAPWNPALLNAGYNLWAVERPLDAGVAERAAISASHPTVQPNPVADVVLYSQGGERYILIECKASSFGAGSEHAPQARGLIVGGGRVVPRLGLVPSATAEVCYLVPGEEVDSMDRGLLDMAREAFAQGFPSCDTGVVGLSVRPDGVYLGLTAEPQGAAKMPRTLIPEQRIADLRPGQDARPLYVIPWIPDASNDQDLTAFREKLRAQTLAWLGRASLGEEDTLSFDYLLDEVSRGIYRSWRDRDSLRGRVFPTVRKLLTALFNNDARVRIRNREVILKLDSDNDREQVMEAVRTAHLPARLPEGVQLPLETEMDANTD